MAWSLVAFQLMSREGYDLSIMKGGQDVSAIAFTKSRSDRVIVSIPRDSDYELAIVSPDLKKSSVVVFTGERQKIDPQRLPYIRLKEEALDKVEGTRGEYSEAESAGVV